jgi:hypothetical protein
VIKPPKITVTMKSLVARLNRNRRLIDQRREIRSPLGRMNRSELGDYFLIERGAIVEVKLTPRQLEAMARQVGALKPWEEMERQS